MSGGQQKEEEMQNLQKYVSSLEGELDDVHSQLADTSTKLDATDKQLATVLYFHPAVSSFFFFFLFFRRLISAAADWMSTILSHIVWPQCEFKMQV